MKTLVIAEAGRGFIVQKKEANMETTFIFTDEEAELIIGYVREYFKIKAYTNGKTA